MITATEIVKEDNKEDGIWYKFTSLLSNGNRFEDYIMFIDDEREFESTVYVWGAAGSNLFFSGRKEFNSLPEAEQFAYNYLNKVRTNFINFHSNKTLIRA